MNIKKPLLVAGVVTTISAAGLAGNNLASAATTTSSTDSLVGKIAQKFNLKESDVQAVFEDDRKTKEAERQAVIEKELSEAVTKGTITSEQKDKILAKRAELQAQREAARDSMKDKTDAERKAAMQTKRTELEQWAKDNNISTDFMKYVMGHGGGRGLGGPGGPGGRMNE